MLIAKPAFPSSRIRVVVGRPYVVQVFLLYDRVLQYHLVGGVHRYRGLGSELTTKLQSRILFHL